MSKWIVETDLVVSVRVKVIVEAEDKESAIDAAANLLPDNHDPEASKKWRADVTLRPPKGVQIAFARAYHFGQASGAEKARKAP